MREMESRMASHTMANPQRPPGGLLAQGQSSKDASNSHHAHAVVLRSGLELEDPYKDLELEVDEDPKGNEVEMDDEEESSPIEASGKANEDKKGKKACEDLTRRGIQVDKDVDGYFIHMVITDLGNGYMFWLTMVYAYNGIQERKELWERLCTFKRSIQGAWVICGDFNIVLVPAERLGGNITVEEMEDFKACLVECEVADVPASGSFYTWCNKQFYCEGVFDHTPCVIQAFDDREKKIRSFKYYNMWSQDGEFKQCVQTNWKGNWYGTKMYKVTRQLKNLKIHLRKLNKENFADIENNCNRAKMNLEYIQDRLRVEPQNTQLIEMETEASNSAVQSKVWNITNTQGVLCEDIDSIQTAFLQFYTSLLGTSTETRQVCKAVVQRGQTCTEDHQQILLSPVSDEEIKKVMFSIPSHKVAGRGEQKYTIQFYNMDTIRLSAILPDIISENQSGFIKGRSIVENILICQDVVRCYNRKAVLPRFMLKVDLQKAYDYVSWTFLE
ncbi:uncharacterized protein LOC141589753 [Silene latifolia]|uniref:uncharacterized protein LOC141589753 n=1 Tax=Silene latifolia TaxID=37657 RepID=UPI003D77E61B